MRATPFHFKRRLQLKKGQEGGYLIAIVFRNAAAERIFMNQSTTQQQLAPINRTLMIPPLVAHVIRDLEDNFGCTDTMEGGYNNASKQLRLKCDLYGEEEERLFEASSRDDGLDIPPALDRPDRYWHVLSLDLFSDHEDEDDQLIYVQIIVGIGFVPASANANAEQGEEEEVAVAIDVVDGEGEQLRKFQAPLLHDVRAWAAWIGHTWPNVSHHAEALMRWYEVDNLMQDDGANAAIAA